MLNIIKVQISFSCIWQTIVYKSDIMKMSIFLYLFKTWGGVV